MSAAQEPTPHVPSRRLVAGSVLIGLLATGLAVAPSASAGVPIAAKTAPAAAMPNHGITISGDQLTGTTSVTFLGSPDPADDVDAPVFQVANVKTLFVQVPEGAVTGPVRVTTADGAGITPAPVTVLRAPVLTALSSAVGKGLDTITLTGSWLGGKRKVFIAGKAATVLTAAAAAGTNVQELSVVVPKALPGGPTSLVVTNEGGSASRPFYVAPEIKAVAPLAGSTVGGGVALITGSGFAGVEGVTFGGTEVPASQLMGVSDKEIVVRVPAGAVGPAPVVVRTRSGDQVAESLPAVYRYQPVPVVTSVTPNWHEVGPTGRTIVLEGHNLTQDTTVLFGGTAVTPTVDLAAGTLTFDVPASAKPAVVPITLSNVLDGVVFKSVASFGYVGAPTVTKLAPATGPAGTTVVVGGTGFTAGTTARFGATSATCTVVSFTALSCIAPPGTGTANVSVTTPLGTAPSAPAPAVPFAYGAGVLPAPSVKKLLPAMGLPGSTLSVAGANLHLVASVSFPKVGGGWVLAPETLLVGPARLVVRVPEGAASGALRLVPKVGPAVTSGLVRYLAVSRPAVTSVDAVGLATLGVAGGDTVVLRGSGLTAGPVLPVVTVGGVVAPVLKSPVPTSTAIAVKVPVGAGKRAPIVVTTPFGSTTAAAQLYYVPRIAGAKLVSALADGRHVVMVTGQGFTGAHSVSPRTAAATFGGVEATQVVVLSDKALVAVGAPGSVIVDGVVLTTQHETWKGSSQSVTTALTLPVPTATSFTPASAVLGAPAPQVTVTGTNLRADTVVDFGGVAGTVLSAAADGTTLVVVPPTRTSTSSVSVALTNDVNGEPYTVTAADPFRYLPVPSITSVAPTGGWTGSQQPDVTITGRNLRQSTVVRFGGVQAGVVSAAADGTSVTVSPPVRNATGTVEVTATNFVDAEQLSAATAGSYTYSLATATVTGLSATTAAPGTPVTLTGTSFVGVTEVLFGSTPVTFTVPNAGTIFARVPLTPTLLHGTTAAVTVRNGTGNLSTGGPTWTWDSRPMVTGLSITTGQQGATITVTGTGFTGATAVHWGSIAAGTFAVVNDTTLTATVPVTPLGTLTTSELVVTARGLRSAQPVDASGAATPTANDWTWTPIAAISSVQDGVAEGGTASVTGRSFTSSPLRKVTVNGVDVTASVVVVSATQFTYTVPPKPGGHSSNSTDKPILVTNGSGALNTNDTSTANLFTWG